VLTNLAGDGFLRRAFGVRVHQQMRQGLGLPVDLTNG